jgi:Polyketide cyclase / dehydrase and lipid transport.
MHLAVAWRLRSRTCEVHETVDEHETELGGSVARLERAVEELARRDVVLALHEDAVARDARTFGEPGVDERLNACRRRRCVGEPVSEWSPECVACRWIDGATGAAPGAKFEGDNKFVVAGLTLKKWTTTSEVTAYVRGELFEFVAEGYTTWRYDLEATGTGIKVTESYSYRAQAGVQNFLYETVMHRSATMTKGMQQTLYRIKASLESQ